MTQLATFLKSLFPLLCSTSFEGILHSSPHPHATRSSTNPTNLPWFKQIPKVILPVQLPLSIKNKFFNLLNPFTRRLSEFRSLIFSLIFSQLRMTFFHKTMMAEKIFFLQMHNTILQRVK